MLTALIIVLREALEAMFIIILLMNLSHQLKLRRVWFGYALGLGVLGAIIFAVNLDAIIDLADGIGQELLSAFALTLIGIVLIAGGLHSSMYRDLWGQEKTMSQHESRRYKRYPWLFGVALVTAMSLEGGEIIAYVADFAGAKEGHPIIIGGLIGFGIGLSAGAVGYFALSLSGRWRYGLILIFMTSIAAGMFCEVIAFLAQAGLINEGYPIWTSEALVAENSITGQVLYALIGYESTPSKVQAVIYWGTLVPVTLLEYYWLGGFNRTPRIPSIKGKE